MPKGKRKKSRTRSMADEADRYVLYQMSVQEPEHEIEFFDQVYKDANGRTPKILREDFCGTFAVCCEWAKKNGHEVSDRGRIPTGVVEAFHATR